MTEIELWLNDSSADYATGVALFAKYSKNKVLANNFARSCPRFWIGKLRYELGKLVRYANNTVSSVVSAKKVAAAATSSSTPVPQVILSAKKEIASLYSIIDKKHSELFELGTSNADDVVKQRKKLLDERLPIIERADKLYVLKEDWFSGDASAIEKIKSLLSAPLVEQPSLAVPDDAVDVRSMSDVQLVKRRTVLRSAITKTKNMLDFQSIRKGEVATPMPDGPKRVEFEDKLASLQQEFKLVSAEIKRRNL